MAFDEWMAFYNHFCVTGSKITVQFSTRNAEVYDQIVGVYLSDDSTPMTTLYQILEQKHSKWRMCASGASSAPVTVSHTFSHRKFFHQPITDKYIGNAGASPTEGAFFHVFACPVQAVDAAAVDFVVKIDYAARLLEPRTLALS